MKTACVIVIGDEILSGKFADENAALLIRELRALGVDLRRIVVISDVREDIAAEVRHCSARFDYVFTSGGVGPTHDDVTIEAISHAFGVAVARHPELEAKLRAYYGAKLIETNLRLADVPAGAELVYGDDLRWPVVCFGNVYILPGVPALFKKKFFDIRERFRSAPMFIAKLFAKGDEGEFADAMTAAAAQFPAVRIGSYPRFGETAFQVIVTIESVAEASVAAVFELLAKQFGERVVRQEPPASVAGAANAS